MISRRLGGDTVLVHLDTDRVHTLRDSGARFWELLSSGARWGEIRARLLEEFEVEEGELDASLQRLIASLVDEDLVHPKGTQR